MEALFYPDPLIRLPLYIGLGIITEVIFTGTMDLISPSYLSSWRLNNPGRPQTAPYARNPRAIGYTFLWMFPLYGLLIAVEPLYQALMGLPWFLRGLVYLAVFWFGEYVTGALIKKIIGVCPWDYSNSRYSLHGYIRWDFAPFWYVFSLFVEQASLKFAALTPAIKALF